MYWCISVWYTFAFAFTFTLVPIKDCGYTLITTWNDECRRRCKYTEDGIKSNMGRHCALHLKALHLSFAPPKLLLSQPAAASAEGGGAHRHRDADCGAAQAANRRREREGELRASASRPLVQRLRYSPDILMRDPACPQRSTLTAHDALCSQACRSTNLGCRRMQV